MDYYEDSDTVIIPRCEKDRKKREEEKKNDSRERIEKNFEKTDLKEEITLFVWKHAPENFSLEKAKKISLKIYDLLEEKQ